MEAQGASITCIARHSSRLHVKMIHHLQLIALLFTIGTHQAHSYIGGSDINPNPLLCRLHNVQCKLIMNVGRTPNTAMPREWAASGAKLALPLEVKFTAYECAPDMNTESLLGGDLHSSFLVVEPKSEPTFVSMKGQETVKVMPGAYNVQAQSFDEQQHSLRFFLDFPDGAVRNDVSLPKERIYFMTACWDENDKLIEQAMKWRQDILKSLYQINIDLRERSWEKNNGSLFGAADKFRHSVELAKRRSKLELQLEMLEDRFPLEDGRLVNAPNNLYVLKEGVIAVKRFSKDRAAREEYHWVGTFCFKEFSKFEE